MKANRYLLCLLISSLLLYFAVPRLHVFSDGLQGVFAVFWLAFALIVIAGNLTALLYVPKRIPSSKRAVQTLNERIRARSFHR